MRARASLIFRALSTMPPYAMIVAVAALRGSRPSSRRRSNSRSRRRAALLPCGGRATVPARANHEIAPRGGEYRTARSIWFASAGHDGLEVVEVPGEADVVDALVGLPVLSHVETDVGQDDLQVRLVDVVEPLLIICFVDAEDTEVGEEGNDPMVERAPAAVAVLCSCTPALKKVVGKGLREVGGLDRVARSQSKHGDGPLWGYSYLPGPSRRCRKLSCCRPCLRRDR